MDMHMLLQHVTNVSVDTAADFTSQFVVRR